MIETLARISQHFPELGLGSSSLDALSTLRSGAEPARYAAMSVFFSLALAVLALAVSAFAFGPMLAIPIAFLAFALAFLFFLRLPGMELGKRAAEIENEMPFFLRSTGMLIGMGIPFQRALGIAAEDGGTLGQEMRHVDEEVRDGIGLQRALSSFALSFGSLGVKRAVSQLLSAYEVGGGAVELRRIGDDLLALERHRMREYAARNAMFGLLFMMSAAILPTFFLVYAVLGKFAFGAAVSQAQVALGLLVVFPLISVLIALLSKATMPRSAFCNNEGFDARMLAPGAVFMAGFVLVPQLQLPALLLGTAIAAYLAYSCYTGERRLEEIERQLPDALFSVSGLPKSTRVERIFGIIEGGGHGAISEEAAKARRQLAMNLKTDAVLEDFGNRNRSPMVWRACNMMKQMIATNSLDRLSALAEDMIASFQLKRERSQMFSMQKYTLMAGALLIPAILKTALKLLGSMGGLFGDGSAGATIAFASSIVPPYLVIYALISSAVIADSEGRKSSAALYFLGLAAASLLAFHFINL
jgi:Flp pilus assembly protein TadB